MKRSIMTTTKRITRDIYLEYKGKTRFTSALEEDEWDKITPYSCNKCGTQKMRFDFQNNTCGSLPFENIISNEGIRYKRGECKDCQKRESKGKAEAIKKAKQLGLPTKAPEGTKCKICGNTQKIVFDHCHQTSDFRGWLCDPCNRSLGILGDNVSSLVGVINYLNQFEKKKIIQDPTTLECKLVTQEEKEVVPVPVVVDVSVPIVDIEVDVDEILLINA
jgi:hypothetical protein